MVLVRWSDAIVIVSFNHPLYDLLRLASHTRPLLAHGVAGRRTILFWIREFALEAVGLFGVIIRARSTLCAILLGTTWVAAISGLYLRRNDNPDEDGECAMARNVKETLGLVGGLIAILCVMSGIKIGTHQYLGQVVLEPIHVGYNKIVAAGIFILAFWPFTRIAKNPTRPWVRWGRLAMSVFMLAAVVSYVIFR